MHVRDIVDDRTLVNNTGLMRPLGQGAATSGPWGPIPVATVQS